MTRDFDPYYTWLGIPPADQPPDAYRLLGIGRFENNPDAISNAADQRMRHIRTVQMGQYAQHSQEILGQLASARILLLNPERKEEYDRQLEAGLKAADPVPLPNPFAPSGESDSHPGKESQAQISIATVTVPKLAKESRGRTRQPYSWFILGTAGLGLCIVVVLVLAVTKPWSKKSTPADQDSVARTDGVALRNEEQPSAVVPAESAETNVTADGGSRRIAVTAETNVETHSSNPNNVDLDATIPAPTKTPIKEPSTADSTTSETHRVAGAPTSTEEPSNADKTDDVQPAGAILTEARDEALVEPALSPQEERLAIPDAEAQLKARQLVQEVYGQQITDAKTAEQRTAIVRQLLDVAVQSVDDETTCYVLLTQAGNLATQAGDAELIVKVVAILDTRYRVDSLQFKSKALSAASRNILDSKARTSLVSHLLEVANEANLAERFDIARASQSEAISGARRIRSRDLIEEAVATGEEIEAREKQYQAANNAAAILAKTPDDPEASLVYGKYLCLRKEDWKQGLPMLAICGDVKLMTAAKLDLAGGETAEVRTEIGDSWYELAQLDDEFSNGFYKRAKSWYEKALPSLDGLVRAKVQQRIGEANDALTTATTANAIASTERDKTSKPKPPGAPDPPRGNDIFAKRRIVIAVDEHEGFSGRDNSKNVYAFAAPRPVLLQDTVIFYRARGAAGHDTNGTVSLSLDGESWLPVGEWTAADMEVAAKSRDDWHYVDFSRLEKNERVSKILIKFQYTSGGQLLKILGAAWSQVQD